jgi:hypothetical protein
VLNTDQVGAFVVKLTRMTDPIQVTELALGRARMRRYLDDCSGDPARARQLFEWNVRMAGATHEALHVFEIIIRNAMDRELRAWNAREGHGEEWLLTPDPRLLKLLNRDSLVTGRKRARQIAKIHGRTHTHDDVLAQMTLGTWRYLLPSNSTVGKQRLWDEALGHAFPEWGGGWQPLVSRVEIVHELRNRVAHLEPLHRGRLRQTRQAMRHVTSATGREGGRLFVQCDRMLPLLDELPKIVAVK